MEVIHTAVAPTTATSSHWLSDAELQEVLSATGPATGPAGVGKAVKARATKPKATKPKATKPKASELLPDAAKPWTDTVPRDLFVRENGVSEVACERAWEFFHPETDDFPWFQRFPRFPSTAHYNGFHAGKYDSSEESQAELREKYPALYEVVQEAVATAKRTVSFEEMPQLETFVPEAIAVMRHRPGWGLGEHYDTTQDPGEGMVLMISLSDSDVVPRKFKFLDPPRGREYTIETRNRQLIVFGGEAYDEWMHMSVRNKKQSGEIISVTVRLSRVCGYLAKSADSKYAVGAPAAKKEAHRRIKAKMDAEEAIAKR